MLFSSLCVLDRQCRLSWWSRNWSFPVIEIEWLAIKTTRRKTGKREREREQIEFASLLIDYVGQIGTFLLPLEFDTVERKAMAFALLFRRNLDVCACVCIIFICQISPSEPIRTNTSAVIRASSAARVATVMFLCSNVDQWCSLLRSSSSSMRMIKRRARDSLVPSASVFVPNKYWTFSIDVSQAFIPNELPLFRSLVDMFLFSSLKRWNGSAECSEHRTRWFNLATSTRDRLAVFLLPRSPEVFYCGFAQFRRHLEIIRPRWEERRTDTETMRVRCQ